VELGPGTGVFTRELLRSVRPQRLILVEFDRQFAAHLRRAHKGVKIVRGDARHLPDFLLKKGQYRVPKILSGLPLRGMTPSLRRDISKAMAEALEPGGSLVQFTYFKAPPLDEHTAAACGLEVVSVQAVMANLPPAFVWLYRKRLDA
jgi:phosphatidylethanolamine/phosphatidyl-N-methylethanolamine N-methyltransferase